jgi:hypothetical protein
MPLAGGYSDEKVPDDEIQTLFSSVSESLSVLLSKPIENLILLSYQSQVVAGVNYRVKATVTVDGETKELRTINIGQKDLKLKENDRVFRNGVEMQKVLFPRVKTEFNIEEGDIVERQLMNGDVVLLNRQPTLHKGSMLAKEVVIRPCKTFRFNLASTKSFNADFDGDEMNIHVAQGYEARVEMKELCATKHNIISPQSSQPNIVIVQDSLLGSYIMTKPTAKKLTKEEFLDVAVVAIHLVQVDGKHALFDTVQFLGSLPARLDLSASSSRAFGGLAMGWLWSGRKNGCGLCHELFGADVFCFNTSFARLHCLWFGMAKISSTRSSCTTVKASEPLGRGLTDGFIGVML